MSSEPLAFQSNNQLVYDYIKLHQVEKALNVGPSSQTRVVAHSSNGIETLKLRQLTLWERFLAFFGCGNGAAGKRKFEEIKATIARDDFSAKDYLTVIKTAHVAGNAETFVALQKVCTFDAKKSSQCKFLSDLLTAASSKPDRKRDDISLGVLTVMQNDSIAPTNLAEKMLKEAISKSDRDGLNILVNRFKRNLKDASLYSALLDLVKSDPKANPNSLAMMQLLVEKGEVDVSASDDKLSALYYAVQCHRENGELIQYLLNKGARFNWVDIGDLTDKEPELIKELSRFYGVNLGVTDKFHRLICDLVASKSKEKSISALLQSRAECFSIKGQDIAKEVFREAMDDVLGSTVDYVTADDCAKILSNEKNSVAVLDPKLFIEVETSGVQYDIINASHDNQHVHLFSVASQYNCTEAATAVTPKLGEVMKHSKSDKTQGPLAQRTNPIAFELVNAFLAHLGFNMMDRVLPGSVGKTYPTSDREKHECGKTSILHGYLKPAGFIHNPPEATKKSASDDLEGVVAHMESNLALFETVCYSSNPPGGGPNPVHLILAAAPSCSEPNYPSVLDDLEYYAALANFTTQFKQLKKISAENPTKKAVLHVTLPGLGVFGNKPQNVARAFTDAALFFEGALLPGEKERLQVRIDVYGGGTNQVAQEFLREVFRR